MGSPAFLRSCLVLMLLISTSQLYVQVNGLWVGIHENYHSDSPETQRFSSKPDLKLVRDGQVIRYQFQSDTNYEQHAVTNIKLVSDTFDLKAIGSYQWIYDTDDTLTLVGDQLLSKHPLSRVTHTLAAEVDSLGSISDMENYLTNSWFDVSNGDYEEGSYVHFLPDHQYVLSQQREYGQYRPYWSIMEIDDKYFFLINSGTIIRCFQITGYDAQRLHLVIHNPYDSSTLRFDRLDLEQSRHHELLLGKWKRIVASESGPSEILVFDESKVNIEKNGKVLRSSWQLFFNGRTLRLPEYDPYFRYNQWTIKKISQDSLHVYRRDESFQFETIRFLKIRE